MTAESPEVDLTGLPDIYFARIFRLRVASLIVLAISGGFAAIFGYAAIGSRISLMMGVVPAAVFLLLCVGLMNSIDPRSARRTSVHTRIVPYFESKVPGDDTFFRNGHCIALNCKRLDAIASHAGLRTLSSFGFRDAYENWLVAWHQPDACLATITYILENGFEGQEPISDPDTTRRELEKVAAKLQDASRTGTRFCLHLRWDSAYSALEFERRNGRYF